MDQRKLIAVLLTAAMTASLLPTAAFAYEEEPARDAAVMEAAQPEDTPDAAPADIAEAAAEPAAAEPEDTPDAAPEDEDSAPAELAEFISGSCGSGDMTWTLDTETGVLYINGTGMMSEMHDYWLDRYTDDVTSVVIGEGVTYIGFCAFSSCSNLREVSLPESLTSIGGNAFSGTAISKLRLPKSLTQIGRGAFHGCEFLGDVYYPGTQAEWDAIEIDTDNDYLIDALLHLGGVEYSGTCGPNLNWVANMGDGRLVITGTGPMYDYPTRFYVPWVNDLGDDRYLGDIHTVELPEGLTTISAHAFEYMVFESIAIPAGVTSIGEEAFYGCKKMETLTIGDGVESIGVRAFQYCDNLSFLALPASLKSIGYEAFDHDPALTDVFYNGTEADWDSIAIEAGNEVLTAHGIHLSSEIIIGTCGEDLKWALNTGSGELTITGTGPMYDYHAKNAPWYLNREYVEKVILPEGITHIGDNAFCDLSNMREISLPESVTSLGQSAFQSCTGLETIGLNAGLKTIGQAAFRSCSRIETLTIPNGVERISGFAFAECFSLQAVDIPGSVFFIDYKAFFDCWSMTTLVIRNGVTVIGGKAFERCRSLETVDIPVSIIDIADGAFKDCDHMVVVRLGSSVESIGAEAFGNCVLLKCLSLPASLKSIGEDAFKAMPWLTVCYEGTEADWGGIAIAEGNYALTDCDIHYSSQILIGTTCGQRLKWVLSPEAGWLVIMGRGPMYDYENSDDTPWHEYRDSIHTVKLPNWLTTIGACAFSDMGLESVAIPADVTSIGTGAFRGCHALRLVTAGEGVTDIGANAFDNCESLSVLVLPAGLKSIGMNAFADNAALAEIYYGGTEADWDGITIEAGNDALSRAVIHYQAAPRALAITAQPQNAAVDYGEQAAFSAAAEGMGLTYQWQYRTAADAEWKDNTKLEGCTADTLRVTGNATRNGYEYRCVITDIKGDTLTTEPAVLTVNMPFAVTGQPQNVTASVNDTAKFTVTAEGISLKYQWQYKSPKGTSWANTTLGGNKTATLTVPASAGRDGYSYRCVITDVQGKSLTSEPAVLTVDKPLVIHAQPQNVKASVGDTAKFTVTAEGIGLHYQWQYKSLKGTSWANTGLTGNKTATLTVPASAGRDGYSYRCVITDNLGRSAATEPAVLTVDKPLVINGQPQNVTASVGDTAKFIVTASGSGLHYQWQYKSPKGADWANTTLTGNKTAALTVKASAGRNGYSYRCVITDRNGDTLATEPAVLTVQ